MAWTTAKNATALRREMPVPETDEEKRRDSVSLVGPYARIRIIAAVIVLLVAFAVIGYRSFFG